MTDADVRGLLSVLGTLLAAYGFFYNSVRDRLSAALSLPKRTDAREKAADAREMKYPNALAVILAVSAAGVAAAFVQPAWTLVWDGVHDGGPYNATRAGFLLLELFWVFVAVASAWQAVMLTKKRSKLKG